MVSRVLYIKFQSTFSNIISCFPNRAFFVSKKNINLNIPTYLYCLYIKTNHFNSCISFLNFWLKAFHVKPLKNKPFLFYHTKFNNCDVAAVAVAAMLLTGGLLNAI